MKKYRLIISSESDHDYKLKLDLKTLGNHFKLKTWEDEFDLTADFHFDNEKQFCNKLYEIFNEFKIDSNKEYLVSQFNEHSKKLLNQLYEGIVISPDNFFGGNQDLMITFSQITETDL